MTLQSVAVKSVLNKTKRRDRWFLDDYTVNPYSGCSFNCLYCYIRGSKYGINMAEKVSVKSNALELLEKQLANRARKGQQGVVVLSSSTDPYIHFEREIGLTRQVLELLLKYRFPVHIITKSDLVLRDLDLLHRINESSILPIDLKIPGDHKAFVTFSFSTLDAEVASIFEPGAPPPDQRLRACKQMLDAGVLSGVSLMPLLPYISDTGTNLHHMFGVFSSIGVKYLFPSTITLFGNEPADSRTLVFRALKKHFPQLFEKYSRLFSESGQLPSYYNIAFNKKAIELCRQYGLKNSIV